MNELRYGMVLPPEPAILSVEQLLIAAATIRGFMAIGGRPDQSRAARIILKDFVSVGWIKKTKGMLGIGFNNFSYPDCQSSVLVFKKKTFL